MSQRIGIITLLFFAFLFSPTWMFGQTTAGSSGSLLGTVRDASGAVVPGAKLVATRNETGIAYENTTSQTGDYFFPNLPIGTYTLTVTAPSFQEEKIEKIEIQIDSTFRQDATLQLKTVATKIEVVASTPMVNSETSEIGTTITADHIQDLPIVGRDVYSLIQLTPNTNSEDSTTRPTIAGARAGATQFRIDGATANTVNQIEALADPSADSVAEFRVETQLTTALSQDPANVQIVMKSGTNQFHGTAFEFLQNNVANGHSYFYTPVVTPTFTSSPDQQRWNDFGGTLGGPIRREKMFFFGNFEGQENHYEQQQRGLTPTAAMLSGDFSGVNPEFGSAMQTFGPVIDPQTQNPFPGNIIPQSRFSKFATNMLPLTEPANCMSCLAAGLGFDDARPSTGAHQNYEQYTLRIDYVLGPKDNLFGSVDTRAKRGDAGGFQINAMSLMTAYTQNTDIALSEVHTFSPSTLNEVRAGYARRNFQILQNSSANGAFPFPNLTYDDPKLFPWVIAGGYTTFGNPLSSSTQLTQEETYTYNDTLTFHRGHHQIRVGTEFLRQDFIVGGDSGAWFIFEDNFPSAWGFSGSAFADFLLGNPFLGLATEGGPQGYASRVDRWVGAGFVQDDWKVNSRLTLNLGLRYELPARWNDFSGKNRMGTLDTSATSMAMGGRFLLGGSANYYLPNVGVVQGTGPALIPPALLYPSRRDWEPRIGFAFRPFDSNKTVIRGGGGIYFDIPDANIYAFLVTSPPFKWGVTEVNVPAKTIGPNFFPPSASAGGGGIGLDPHNRDPRLYQWTLSLQHQIAPNIMLSADYIGNHGQRFSFTTFVNQPSLPTGADLANLLLNPGEAATDAYSRTPFANITPNFFYYKNLADSWYQALNLKAQGRWGDRMTFTAFYTWSKNLDQAGYDLQDYPTDSHNLALNKTYADVNIPNRFVASWVYPLPFGKEASLTPSNHALRKLVGGWELTGVTIFETGMPFSVNMGVDTSFRDSVGSLYPVMTGPPVYSDIRKTGGLYLTPTNFTAPPFGQLGTLARNAFVGPGVNNWNLGFVKSTNITEKLRTQVRVEMANAFNHAQFGIGSQSLAWGISNPAPGTDVPVIDYNPPSGFGRAYARDPRTIQFGLKFIF